MELVVIVVAVLVVAALLVAGGALDRPRRVARRTRVAEPRPREVIVEREVPVRRVVEEREQPVRRVEERRIID